MKINTIGFSVIEFVMIVVVLIIVGVFVYFASQSKKVEISSGSVATTNPSSAKESTFDKKFVINAVKIIASDAETKYSGNYTKSFAPLSSSKNNGSGIISKGDTEVEQVIISMAKFGGSLFAITNKDVSAYVLYGSLPNTNNTTYYCLGSDGSTKDSTTAVADSESMIKKPYCK